MLRRREFLTATATLLAAAGGVLPIARAQGTGLRIGALNPVTGAGAQYGSGMQATIKGVVDLINSNGGVWGQPIEFFAEDTQTAPEAGVLAAKKLVEVDKVNAVLGTWSSGVAMSILTSVTDPADTIHMSVCGAREFTQSDKRLAWRFTPSSYAYGVIYAKIAAELGFKRPATLNFNNASGSAQIAGFTDQWKKQGGEIVSSVVYEPKRPTYRSEVQTVLAAQPDVIVCGSYITDLTSILREWYQTGIPAKFIVPFWAAGDKLFSALGNEVVEGINLVTALVVDDSPSAKAYGEMYEKLTGNPGNSNIYGAMCYDMINVIALAAEAAGPGADTAAINAKVRDVTNGPGTVVYSFAEGVEAMKKGPINYSGAYSDLSFDERGDDSASLFGWEKVENGKSVPVKTVSLG